jgi:hypothetical protein
VTDTEVRLPAQRPALQRLAGMSTFWIALVLVALCVLFSALRPDAFPTLFTLQTLLIEASVWCCSGCSARSSAGERGACSTGCWWPGRGSPR